MNRLICILLLSISLTGCAAQQTQPVNQLPISSTEVVAWQHAVDYFGIIETGRHTATALALILSKQNPPAVPLSVLSSLEKVDRLAIAATKLLQSTPNKFDQPVMLQVASLANQIVVELAQWKGAITNPPLLEQLSNMTVAAENVRRMR